MGNKKKRQRKPVQRFSPSGYSTPGVEVTQENSRQNQSASTSYITLDNATQVDPAMQTIIEQQGALLKQQSDIILQLQRKMMEMELKINQPVLQTNSVAQSGLQQHILPGSSTQGSNHQSHPSAPTPTLVMNMPPLNVLLPTFDGSDTGDPIDFLNKTESILKTYNIPTDNWVMLVTPQVIGQARIWLNSIPDLRTYSFVEFRKRLLEKYDCLQVKIKLQALFYGTTQNYLEPSSEFIQKKVVISHKLMKAEWDEKVVLLQILELLHPSVKVFLSPLPNSVDELLTRVKTIDQALQLQSSSGVQGKNYGNVKSSYGRQNSRIDGERKNDHTANNSQSNPPKCNRCNNGYHFYKDCKIPNPSALNNSRWVSNQNNNQQQNSKSNNSSWVPNQDPSKKETVNVLCMDGYPDCRFPARINILVDDKPHVCLVDSGAYPNFIDVSLLDKNDVIQPNTTRKVIAAWRNSERENLGTITKVIQLGTQKFRVPFSVVDDLNEGMLLGHPFLIENKSVLDYSQKALILGTIGRECVHFIGYHPTHLNHEQINEIDHSLPEGMADQLFSLLNKFPSLFSQAPLKQTDAIKHKITVKTTKPICVKYSVSPEKKRIISEQVKSMLDQRIIEESTSPYSFPVVIVPKEGKEPRFCVDYRRLNEITVAEECQGISIKELIDKVGNKKIFSSLDLRRGYWQVLLEDDSKHLTAFTNPADNKRYQFRVMSFGLTGAPGTFMRLMRKVLDGYLGVICEVFLDDILVHSNTYEEHFLNLELIFERLKRYGLTLAKEKCHIAKLELKYLGHMVSSEGHRAPESHTLAILNYPSPTTKKKLQGFIGTANWLRDYVPRAAEVLAPLTSILKRKPFKWTQEDEANLSKAKEAFQQLDPLHSPQEDLPLILQTDASAIGMAATLYQEKEGRRLIIANISSKFTPAETRYHINEQEMLATIWACRRLKCYLDGVKFVLRTDSKALTWLNKMKGENAKLMRWALQLQEYQFSLEHIPGRENELPDAMSRNPMEVNHTLEVSLPDNMFIPDLPDDKPDGEMINSLNLSQLKEDILKCQRMDKFCEQVRRELLEPDSARHDRYKVENNMIMYKVNKEFKIFVPTAMVKEVIAVHHEGDLYRHPGSAQTIKNCQKFYTWPNMTRQIRMFVKNCEDCARTKVVGRTNKPTLVARQVVQPLHTLSIDLMGPYTRSKAGKRFLLVLRHPQDAEMQGTDHQNIDDYVLNLNEKRLAMAINIKKKQQSTVEEIEKEPTILEEGTIVLIRNHVLSNAVNKITASLSERWIGPYKILKRLGQNVYQCQNINNKRDIRKVDISDIQVRPN
ncbi:hypothetical protein WDU94_003573 [Cyamophila willieti]